MSAESLYREFHGKNPRYQSGVNFHVPKRLVYLGDAVAIEYRCNKLNGGGDGKRAVYRHKFETPAKVCMDERGRYCLYIIGNRIVVDDEGIKN
jgi:hypothetical protein